MITADHTIFTSVRTPMGCGYRLIAASPGVTAEERAEITRWSPSHGNLCSEDPAAEGLASYILSTGRRCVAWSRHAGPEPTGRGGLRIHTHAVLLTPEAYRQLACMPAAVLPAIEALTRPGATACLAGQGPTAPDRAIPPASVSIPLMPPGPSLAPLTITPAALAAGTWTQCPFDSLHPAAARALAAQPAVIITPQPPVAQLTATLAVLPAYAREPLTLAAGLRYSPTRPATLTWLSTPLTPAESAGLAAQLLDTRQSQPNDRHLCPWLQLMGRWWAEGRHAEILELTESLTMKSMWISVNSTICSEATGAAGVESATPSPIPAKLGR